MNALIKAFLRCLSLLLPPPWLQLGFCWWVGDACGKTLWPNPRARLRQRTLLAHQEVQTQDISPSSVQGCSSSSLHWLQWGRVWELWKAVARVSGLPFALHRHWCQQRRALRTPETHGTGEPVTNAAIDPIVNISEGEEVNILEEDRSFPSVSAPKALAAHVEATLDSTKLALAEEIMVDQQQQEIGTQVTITVAIQEAEDEEPATEMPSNSLNFYGGSCSEDDTGRREKSSGAGTSGGEAEEESWQPPHPELSQKLVAQIEYYLSDENLEHDAFLLKHIRRNKLGYVSIKLLTSFKKVKHLTRDWRTTACALRQSTVLELNEEGRKVRRRSAVPVFASESLPSRMLLLSELQRWPELGLALQGSSGEGDGVGAGSTQQEYLMELLLKAFGAYGSIASVRVLKPGKDLPVDLKKLSGRYTQLSTEECAIVEFEEVEAAIKASEAMGCGDGVAGPLGVKVILIGTKPPKKKLPKDKPQEANGTSKSRSLNSRVRELQYQAEDSACSSSETESNPTSPRFSRKVQPKNKLSPPAAGSCYHQNNHLSPAVSPWSSPWSSPRASPSSLRKSPHPCKSPLASEGRLSPESGQRRADYSSDSSLTPSGSPWVQRRRQVASQESSPVGSPMLGRKIQNADGLPLGVLRLPRGPDGTRGFHCATMEERGKAAGTQT
ncbi:la-related protein 6-like [Brienomyrus brachyistius]|uniref:la-related protein 6-like n=1 Tax=Brienomyrus brachyistius TaxID=42636 RepID=UPI0020B3FBE4|nr:la-related protein 6-like [Brienomyrus brachyistius]